MNLSTLLCQTKKTTILWDYAPRVIMLHFVFIVKNGDLMPCFAKCLMDPGQLVRNAILKKRMMIQA
jgi:hypothetical protein